jgi:hypothetical protein
VYLLLDRIAKTFSLHNILPASQRHWNISAYLIILGLHVWKITVRTQPETRDFKSPKRPKRIWDPSEYLRLLPRGEGGGIRPEHEAHHSLLSFTKVKNEWSCTSTFPYAFMTTTTTALHLLRGIQLEGWLRMWSKDNFEDMLTDLQIWGHADGSSNLRTCWRIFNFEDMLTDLQIWGHADGSSNSIKALDLFYVIRRLGGTFGGPAFCGWNNHGKTTTALELPTKARQQDP